MVEILNGNDEIVIFNKGDQFEILEHYYDNTFMGYNLMLEDELIDTYDEEESAVLVMGELCNRIDSRAEFIDIKKVNNLLEV